MANEDAHPRKSRRLPIPDEAEINPPTPKPRTPKPVAVEPPTAATASAAPRPASPAQQPTSTSVPQQATTHAAVAPQPSLKVSGFSNVVVSIVGIGAMLAVLGIGVKLFQDELYPQSQQPEQSTETQQVASTVLIEEESPIPTDEVTQPDPLPPPPVDAAALLQAAEDHLAKNEFAAAVECCNKVLAEDAQALDALQLRGNAYQAWGEYDKAIADYAAIIRIDGSRLEALMECGRTFVKKKDFQSAASCFSQLLTTNPRYVDALMARGDAYFQLQDDDKALADFTLTIQIAPNHFQAYAARGNCLKRKGKLEEAINDYFNSLRLESKGFAACYAGPTDADRKDTLATINRYTALIEHPQDNNLSDFGAFDALVNRGQCYFNIGDYKNAIADLSQAHRMIPRNYLPILCLGRSYLATKDYDKAIAAFNDGLISGGDTEQNKLGLAEAYSKKGIYKKAIELYKEVAIVKPDTAAEVALARIYLSCPNRAFRNRDEVERLTKKKTKLFRGGYGDNDPGIWPIRAEFLASKGDYAEAITWQAKAIPRAKRSEAPELARQLAEFMVKAPGYEFSRISLQPRKAGGSASSGNE